MTPINETLEFLTLSTFPEWLPVNYERYFHYLPLLLIGFIASVVLTPLIGRLSSKLNIRNETKDFQREKLNKYDNPDRRINPNPVPLLGGIAVFLPFILVFPFLFGFDSISTNIFIGLIIIFVVGILDDLYNLPALYQLTGHILAVMAVVTSPINLEVIRFPIIETLPLNQHIFTWEIASNAFEFVLWGDLLLAFWLLICINAVKWVGGVDALLETMFIIIFLLLSVIGLRTGNIAIVVISFFLLGGVSGFTIFNFPPAKIFSGSVGKTSLGFIAGVISSIGDAKFTTGTIILLLPIVDFIFVIIKRVVNRKPKDFAELVSLPIKVMRTSDTNHLHHQLLKLNLKPIEIVWVEILIVLGIGAVSILTAEAYRLLFITLIAMSLFIGILLIHITVNKRDKKPPKDNKKETPESKYSY